MPSEETRFEYPYTSMKSFASNERHLLEAVALTTSVIERYERCGRRPSEEEQRALRTLQNNIVRLTSTATSPAVQSLSPGTLSPASLSLSGSTSQKSSLLKKFAAVTGATFLYKDLVNVKTDVDSLTRFVLSCSDVSITAAELATTIAQEVNMICAAEVVKHVYFLDARDEEFLVDPLSHHTVQSGDPASPVGVCSDRTDFTDSDGLVYVSLRCNAIFVGVVVMRLPATVDAAKQQTVSAVLSAAALCVRSQRLCDSLRWQVSRGEVMLSMAAQLSRDNLEEAVLVQSIMSTAKALIDSDRCSIFIVDSSERKLLAYFEAGQTVALDIGVGIAGHVARTGETVNIADAYNDPRFNPDVDKATGYRTKSILCMPVKYEETIVAVAQLVNKNPKRCDEVDGVSRVFERSFSALDEELFSTFSTFSGVCLRNCRISQKLQQEKRKGDATLEVVALLSQTDIRDVDGIVGHVMLGAKKLLGADRTSLFLLDKERNELFSKGAHSTGGKEIRFPAGRGIAGTVALSGVGENITDAYSDERFNRDIDRQLGYRTKSILCEPICLNGEVLAVAQLVNKTLSDGTVAAFSPEDQEAFKTFALFAAISINNSYLLEFAVKAGREAMELTSVMESRNGGLPPPAEVIPVPSCELGLISQSVVNQDVTTIDFDIFQVMESERPLDAAVLTVMQIFEANGFLGRIGCPRDVLLSFVCQCRRRYRTVPYHNFFHVVDVCQTLHTFLFFGEASQMLTEMECFVLLITALAHDLDHMGLNNSFYLKTDSPLGILSSSSGNKSVLEVHHCNVAIEILGEGASNVFRHLGAAEATQAYRGLIDCILATDMSRHDELISAFTHMVDGGFDKKNEQHRRLVMQVLLKAADISNVTKPFDVSRRWAMAVTEEFYQQGDKEKERGVAVLPMFDRAVSMELAKGQLGFITFVAGKFFANVVTDFFTGMRWTTDRIASNTSRWQELVGPK
jgi:cAMP-specific phosphodiesterase